MHIKVYKVLKTKNAKFLSFRKDFIISQRFHHYAKFLVNDEISMSHLNHIISLVNAGSLEANILLTFTYESSFVLRLWTIKKPSTFIHSSVTDLFYETAFFLQFFSSRKTKIIYTNILRLSHTCCSCHWNNVLLISLFKDLLFSHWLIQSSRRRLTT